MQLLRRWVVVSVVPLTLWACGGGDLVLPNEGQPANVEGISGDAQTGTILEPLTDSLVVKVTDRFGNPVAGIAVAWTVVTGKGAVSESITQSGADGTTTVTWTLGERAGVQKLTAAIGPVNGSPVTFTATVLF